MAAWPAGVGLDWLDTVDSTNDEARRRAVAAVPDPLWIAAHRQTKGRGRQGRVWAEADGNLYASLLLRPDMTLERASLHSFVASLAVAELFESVGASAALKWPNDALLNGGKAAGVLLEASGQGRSLDWLVVGIGVNLAAHPKADAAALHPPTDLLTETGAALSAQDALCQLAASFDHWSRRLMTEGFQPIRAAWLARALRLGETIEARLPGEIVTGVFEDVDAAGALVLSTHIGRRLIHAADVYFR